MIADPNSAGYDGQFYYRLALDPGQLSGPRTASAWTASYRFVRIGYPALAWLRVGSASTRRCRACWS